MSDTSGRKRQPKGIPVGGEFAENSHDEAAPLGAEIPEEDEQDYRAVYTIPESSYPEFARRIEQANARLARAGVDERFEVERESRVIHRDDGTFVSVIDARLSSPRISAGDWEFESVHERAENGGVVNYYQTDSASREPVTDMGCEQCGVKRHRGKVYRVRNRETGEVKQIGGSCLSIFTGIKPEGLWSLTYQPDMEDLEYSEDYETGGFHWNSSAVASDRGLILATIRAVAANDGKFISKKNAGYNEKPTSEVVKGSYVALTTEEPTAEENEEIDAVLSYVRDLGDDDFQQNMKTLFAPSEDGNSYIGAKHFGIATYAVESRRRDIARAAERAEREKQNAGKAKSYLAPPKAKLSDLRKQMKKEGKDDTIRARILSVNAGTPRSYGYGPETVPQHVTMMTSEGNIVYWRASDHISFSAGQDVAIDSGTVVENRVSDYNGDYETVITRARLRLLDDEPQTMGA